MSELTDYIFALLALWTGLNRGQEDWIKAVHAKCINGGLPAYRVKKRFSENALKLPEAGVATQTKTRACLTLLPYLGDLDQLSRRGAIALMHQFYQPLQRLMTVGQDVWRLCTAPAHHELLEKL